MASVDLRHWYAEFPTPSVLSVTDSVFSVKKQRRKNRPGCHGFKRIFAWNTFSPRSYAFSGCSASVSRSSRRKKQLRKSTLFLLKEGRSRETSCYSVKSKLYCPWQSLLGFSYIVIQVKKKFKKLIFLGIKRKIVSLSLKKKNTHGHANMIFHVI